MRGEEREERGGGRGGEGRGGEGGGEERGGRGGERRGEETRCPHFDLEIQYIMCMCVGEFANGHSVVC